MNKTVDSQNNLNPNLPSTQTEFNLNNLTDTKPLVLGRECVKYNSFLSRHPNVKQVFIDHDVMMVITSKGSLQVMDTKYEFDTWVTN